MSHLEAVILTMNNSSYLHNQTAYPAEGPLRPKPMLAEESLTQPSSCLSPVDLGICGSEFGFKFGVGIRRFCNISRLHSGARQQMCMDSCRAYRMIYKVLCLELWELDTPTHT